MDPDFWILQIRDYTSDPDAFLDFQLKLRMIPGSAL